MTSGIVYGTLESVNVNLGSGGDASVCPGLRGGTTTLNTNAGADTVNVQTIAGATTVNTGAEADTINVGSLAPAIGGNVHTGHWPLKIHRHEGARTRQARRPAHRPPENRRPHTDPRPC